MCSRDLRIMFFSVTVIYVTIFGAFNQVWAAGLPGDINGDGVVNINDLMIVTANFGKTTSDADLDARADANGDGVVNNTDLLIVIRAFAQEGDTNLTLTVDKENVTVGETVTVTIELAEAAQFASWQTWLGFGSDNDALGLEQQSEGTFTTFVPDSRSLVSINSSGEVRAGGFSLTNNEGGNGTLGIFTFRAVSSLPEDSSVPSEIEIYTENKSGTNPFGAVFSDISGLEFVPTLAVGSVMINVWPQNTTPVVSAGDDRTIRLPNSVTLVGSVNDDGLPDPPGVVTTAWSKVSGPGAVTFDTPSSATTTVSFSDAGIYILRLTANDGDLSTSDDMTVVVDPAPEVYFITPDRIYVEIGESAVIPITVRASNIDMASLVFDFVTNSVEVFGNALFN